MVARPMKSDDAGNLQMLWGNKPCSHPDAISLLSDDGTSTDIWHCTQCGNVVDIEAWQEANGIDDR